MDATGGRHSPFSSFSLKICVRGFTALRESLSFKYFPNTLLPPPESLCNQVLILSENNTESIKVPLASASPPRCDFSCWFFAGISSKVETDPVVLTGGGGGRLKTAQRGNQMQSQEPHTIGESLGCRPSLGGEERSVFLLSKALRKPVDPLCQRWLLCLRTLRVKHSSGMTAAWGLFTCIQICKTALFKRSFHVEMSDFLIFTSAF